ncbi:MAG: LacI family DNA-binding transcriptional regulator [Eubacteriales bacterium]|nr:LacI family DNA-binding transcriptional regulator [Eubacteriales bacterium]
MKPTIKDVARLSQVAISTVSLAFNQPERVADLTKKRIYAVAQELGYTPFAGKSKQHSNVLVIGMRSFSTFHLRIVQGIQQANDLCNLEMIFQMITDETDAGYTYAYSLLENKQVAGLITILDCATIRSLVNLAVTNNIPVVMCAPINTQENVGSVITDNHACGKLLADLYIRKGVRSIGIITDQNPSCINRLITFRETLLSRQIVIPERAVWQLTNSSSVCTYVEQHLLSQKQNLPKALFCINDEIALGVLQTFTKHGISVPTDIGLTGCDDIPAAHIANPPLTTISIPFYENGLQTALLLSRMMTGMPAEHLVLTGKLIERDSL